MYKRSLTCICHSFSYNIRSPFDLKQFKPEGLDRVKQSLSARYRDCALADNVANKLEVYRKSMLIVTQVCFSSNNSIKKLIFCKKISRV